ncbi:MAG: hypothetical protein FJZ90_11235 [Chloroflexi bacterium]|nr:hypothetical protein [Chloroflexota bacterium]
MPETREIVINTGPVIALVAALGDPSMPRTLIGDEDLHPHLRARMAQRGVTLAEMQEVMNHGWRASDSAPGTFGKVWVFTYQAEWEGRFYPEKEATVYYKMIGAETILLTVRARYGEGFPREASDED